MICTLLSMSALYLQMLKFGEEIDEEMEDQFYLRRLEEGLFTLQLVDFIMLEISNSGPTSVSIVRYLLLYEMIRYPTLDRPAFISIVRYLNEEISNSGPATQSVVQSALQYDICF